MTVEAPAKFAHRRKQLLQESFTVHGLYKFMQLARSKERIKHMEPLE
jgi:hypothetical protein